MFRAIDHQGSVDRLTTLARAAATRQDGHALVSGDRHRGRDVVDRFRDDHADRFHLVDRGVRAVAAPTGAIEQHLALYVAGQTHREGGVIRNYWVSDGWRSCGRVNLGSVIQHWQARTTAARRGWPMLVRRPPSPLRPV